MNASHRKPSYFRHAAGAASAGDVEQVALGVVDFLQIGVVADRRYVSCKGITSSSQAITTTARNSRPLARCIDGAARMGNSRWRRLTEERAGSAKSVFHFDVQGSVAKSTHAGIPWLRYIRERLGKRVHFWPFDGWDIPAGRSAIVEVYPALWSRSFANEGRTGDQHDAFSIAAWLSRADRDGSLAAFLKPELSPPERTLAQVEGWILGVPGLIRAAKGRDDSAHSCRSPVVASFPHRKVNQHGGGNEVGEVGGRACK